MTDETKDRVGGGRAAILLPFTASLLGTIAALLIAYFGTIEGQLDRALNRAASLEGYLHALGEDDYLTQRNTILALTVAYDPEVAVEAATRIRTGATVRALEHLSSQIGSPEVLDLIASNLESVPKVLLIDSEMWENTYDNETWYLGGTNADDIADALKLLPVRLSAQAVDENWGTRKEHEWGSIVASRPDLIVLHLDSFEAFTKDSISEMTAFITSIGDRLPDTRFLVYSRKGHDVLRGLVDSVAESMGREYAARRKIGLLSPRWPFSFRSPENAELVRRAVTRILVLDHLYDRPWG